MPAERMRTRDASITSGQQVVVRADDDHRTAGGPSVDVGQPGLHLVHLLRPLTDVVHHLGHITSRHVTSRHATPRHATSHHITSHHTQPGLHLVHLLRPLTDVAHHLGHITSHHIPSHCITLHRTTHITSHHIQPGLHLVHLLRPQTDAVPGAQHR